jgi:hypothetical protein
MTTLTDYRAPGHVLCKVNIDDAGLSDGPPVTSSFNDYPSLIRYRESSHVLRINFRMSAHRLANSQKASECVARGSRYLPHYVSLADAADA